MFSGAIRSWPGIPAVCRKPLAGCWRTRCPLAFAAVGLVILLLRPQDRNVWLLACFFAGLISAFGFPGDYQTVPAPLRPWMELYGGIFLGAIGASFYFLCAVFPARSPIDRRLPWLKWASLVLGLVNAGEMSRPDVSRPVATLSRLIGPQAADQFDFGVALRVSRARAGFTGRQLFRRQRTRNRAARSA